MKRSRHLPTLSLTLPLLAAAAMTFGACSSDRAASPTSATTVTATAGQAATPASTPANNNSSSNNSTATSNVEPRVSTIRTINVHGTGKKSQAPDQVTVTMGVETQALTAAAALQANNAKAAELIKVLKARGVQDKHLQTSQLSINPQYDPTGRRITAYSVSNIVTATLTDITGAGALIDAAAAVAGDAIRVQNLYFSLSDNAEALKVARERAVADARTQAEQLAAAAGVQLGTLRTISSSNVTLPTPIYQQNVAMAKAADASAVPIEAGSQEVTAEVDLVFEIAG